MASISDELLKNISHLNLSAYESRVVHFMWYKIYGFHKTTERISYSQISDGTQIDRRHVSLVLSKLKKRNIITVLGTGYCLEYGIQNDPALWDFDTCSCAKIDTSACAKIDTSACVKLTPQDVPIEEPKLTPNDVSVENPIDTSACVKLTPVDVPTQNVNINKYINNINNDLFTFWNDQKIITHKTIYPKIVNTLKAVLKIHTEDEIRTAITNYAEIQKGDEYYFKHKWTFDEFLTRGLEKFLDGEAARQNYLINKGGWNGLTKNNSERNTREAESYAEFDRFANS